MRLLFTCIPWQLTRTTATCVPACTDISLLKPCAALAHDSLSSGPQAQVERDGRKYNRQLCLAECLGLAQARGAIFFRKVGCAWHFYLAQA